MFIKVRLRRDPIVPRGLWHHEGVHDFSRNVDNDIVLFCQLEIGLGIEPYVRFHNQSRTIWICLFFFHRFLKVYRGIRVTDSGSIGVIHSSVDIKRKVLRGGVWGRGGDDRGSDLAGVKFGRGRMAMEGVDVDREIRRPPPR